MPPRTGCAPGGTHLPAHRDIDCHGYARAPSEPATRCIADGDGLPGRVRVIHAPADPVPPFPGRAGARAPATRRQKAPRQPLEPQRPNRSRPRWRLCLPAPPSCDADEMPSTARSPVRPACLRSASSATRLSLATASLMGSLLSGDSRTFPNHYLRVVSSPWISAERARFTNLGQSASPATWQTTR
jgi:hypothetical protein